MVTRITSSEWRTFRDIRLAALRDTPDAFGSTYEESVARPDEWWIERTRQSAESDQQAMYIARDGDEPVGLAGTFKEAGDWIVIAMWVAPSHRGKGLGRDLLDAVVAFQKEHGATESTLGVTDGNDAARVLYERYGYADTGEAGPLRPGSELVVRQMKLEI